MGRRLISVMTPKRGGPRAGGSNWEVRFYDDPGRVTLSTVYRRETGAGTQPNGAGAGACLKPNTGWNTALLADRLAGDAFVTVVDVGTFQVGDSIPIFDGVNSVDKIITAITPATKRLDLDETLGFAFAAANTKVGSEDVQGHVWGYLDDASDKYVQVKDISSGRLLPIVGIPSKVPATTIELQEEGVAVSTRGKVNFIGAGVTVADDVANVRANVTIDAAPSAADYLVGTAQAGLSAEIVVGATPGGELGGTWAAPTVDATHSGSSHADFATQDDVKKWALIG